jgi:hypothetical protein
VSTPTSSVFNSEGLPEEQSDGINMIALCSTRLQIVAWLDEKQYTQSMLRQTEVHQHSDLADPASVGDTSQG